MDNLPATSCGCLPLPANYFVAKTLNRLSRSHDKALGAAGHEGCTTSEQIVEDLPSGLTLQFENFDGGVRLTIAGKALAANL